MKENEEVTKIRESRKKKWIEEKEEIKGKSLN